MRGDRNRYLDNLPLDEAIDRWYSSLDIKSKREVVDVRKALGRRLAESVRAKRFSPHYPASAMDGIAVRADSTAGASERNPIRLEEGEGYRLVDTGDPLPKAFDGVIMIEEVNFIKEGIAQIEKSIAPGKHIRKVGESLVEGELLLKEGMKVGPYEQALILEGGVKEVVVYKEPQIEVIPTGTELVEVGTSLKPGDIIDFNSYMLSSLAREWGAKPVRHPIIPDKYETIKEAVAKAAKERDMVVINAGSSAGREDYTADIVRELGEVVVHGVSISPGGPVILGKIEGRPVIGVPGYPVAAALTFRIFARTLVYALKGEEAPSVKKMKARLTTKVVSSLGFREFLRVKLSKLDGELVAIPLARSSGVVGSLVEGDGLLVVSEFSEGLDRGAQVEVELLRDNLKLDNSLVGISANNLALDILKEDMGREGFDLIVKDIGGMAGLTSLVRGEAHLGGLFLAEGEGYSYIKRFLKGRDYVGINLGEVNLDQFEEKGPWSISKGDILKVNKGEVSKLRYELILPKDYLKEDRVKGLIEIIEGEEFKARLGDIKGWSNLKIGEVKDIE